MKDKTIRKQLETKVNALRVLEDWLYMAANHSKHAPLNGSQ